MLKEIYGKVKVIALLIWNVILGEVFGKEMVFVYDDIIPNVRVTIITTPTKKVKKLMYFDKSKNTNTTVHNLHADNSTLKKYNDNVDKLKLEAGAKNIDSIKINRINTKTMKLEV